MVAQEIKASEELRNGLRHTAGDVDLGASEDRSLITDVTVAPNGETITVELVWGRFIFHSEWLHDAEMENGPSKRAVHSFFSKKDTPHILQAGVCGEGLDTNLEVKWSNGTSTRFPAIWLFAYAPLVTKKEGDGRGVTETAQAGWLTDELNIPEFSYNEIFPENTETAGFAALKERIYRAILHKSACGIIKIVDLPPPA